MTQTMPKAAIPVHLAQIADQALSDAGNTLRKLVNDARHADCERAFGFELKKLGLDGDMRHFLTAGQLTALGIDVTK